MSEGITAATHWFKMPTSAPNCSGSCMSCSFQNYAGSVPNHMPVRQKVGQWLPQLATQVLNDSGDSLTTATERLSVKQRRKSLLRTTKHMNHDTAESRHTEQAAFSVSKIPFHARVSDADRLLCFSAFRTMYSRGPSCTWVDFSSVLRK